MVIEGKAVEAVAEPVPNALKAALGDCG